MMLFAQNPRLGLGLGLAGLCVLTLYVLAQGMGVLVPVLVVAFVGTLLQAPQMLAWPDYAALYQRTTGQTLATEDHNAFVQSSPWPTAVHLAAAGIAVACTAVLILKTPASAVLLNPLRRGLFMTFAFLTSGVTTLFGLALVPIARRRQPLFDAQNAYLRAAWSRGEQRSGLLAETVALHSAHRTGASNGSAPTA